MRQLVCFGPLPLAVIDLTCASQVSIVSQSGM